MRVHIVYRDAGKSIYWEICVSLWVFRDYMPTGLGILWAGPDEWK